MIVGVVDSNLQMRARLVVHDAAGRDVDVEAAVDTGFSGSLSLPPSVVALMGMPFHSRVRTALGNGQIIEMSRHSGTLLWDGVARHVLIQALDTTPLVGTLLLRGYDVRARMEPGGAVEIEEIP